MVQYQQHVLKVAKDFVSTQFVRIPRSKNAQADALARLATSEGAEKFVSVMLVWATVAFIANMTCLQIGKTPLPT